MDQTKVDLYIGHMKSCLPEFSVLIVMPAVREESWDTEQFLLPLLKIFSCSLNRKLVQKQLERCSRGDPFFRDMESVPSEKKGKSMKWFLLLVFVIVLVGVVVVVPLTASHSKERINDQRVLRKLWPRPKPCSDGRSW